jgi:hypothetical protein
MIEPVTLALIRVGEGRGFVVQTDQARHVIIAAHCLPKIPFAPLGCSIQANGLFKFWPIH